MDRYERGVLEICEDMLRRDSAATLSLFIGMVLTGSFSVHAHAVRRVVELALLVQVSF